MAPFGDESQCDLIIVGAGPAGMMAAAWASRFRISTRVIDRNSKPTAKGQADGLQCRTFEILDSFDIADYTWKHGFHDTEMGVWEPDDQGNVVRKDRVRCQEVGISRYALVSIHQGAIEQSLLDLTDQKFQVERNCSPEALSLDETKKDDMSAYPVKLVVQHESPYQAGVTDGPTSVLANGDKSPRRETINARYLIGCDGAKSWVRKQLEISLEGTQTESVWGVMDIVPLTNFPDIRQSCAIRSDKYGSILNIPRENRINRLYIQLNAGASEIIDRSTINPKSMLEIARKIVHPYQLDFRICDWWSIYQIGQRIASRFTVGERIFLAGDAVHTHSPKLAQGMNVSMQDSYNLGWKLGSVITGVSPRSILATYEAERRAVALQLLKIDEEIARYYSKPQPTVNGVEKKSDDFAVMRKRMGRFLAGVGVTYARNPLVASESACKPRLARNVTLGARIPSCQVLSQSEAKPVQLHDLLKSDGRWRILVFAGDITQSRQRERLDNLSTELAAEDSFVRLHTLLGSPRDSVFEIYAIHNAPRTEVSLLDDFHEIFHHWDEERGWDYYKVYVNDKPYHHVFEDVYERLEIADEGCIVVCRPDQHVGFIGALEDIKQIEIYFSSILTGFV